jgi:hypothetical protein
MNKTDTTDTTDTGDTDDSDAEGPPIVTVLSLLFAVGTCIAILYGSTYLLPRVGVGKFQALTFGVLLWALIAQGVGRIA